MTLTLRQLRQYLPAVSIRAAGDFLTTGLSIDTRTLQSGDLFVALPGEKVDGHQYIQMAADKGASAALVERFVDVDIPQLLVEDVIIAMGLVARAWREICQPSVIAITGSNGKTTVKQMLGAIFNAQYEIGKILITEGNLNNHLGVPLMLSKLTEQTEFAILEHGANHHQEIEYLSILSEPHIAVITNAGPAHLEGFGSLAGVAKAKGELITGLKKDGTAILNADDDYLAVWLELAKGKKVITFGFSSLAEVRVIEFADRALTVRYQGEEKTVTTVFDGNHNALNLAAAVAAAIAAGLEFKVSVEIAANFEQVGGRYQPVEEIKQAYVIDDTYNANPASVIAGMKSMPADAERWLVLGAMGELGESSDELHFEIGQTAKTLGFSRLFVFDEAARPVVEGFGADESCLYKTHDALAEVLSGDIKQQSAEEGSAKPWVLVKGSRSSAMESVIEKIIKDFRKKN
jgi:UDP-N-acetylmuramoyl-tripeptide--D-alanyl-D-alanine ligase